MACRQWHRNQDNNKVTADSVYIVRDTANCPNVRNSWPLVSAPLVEENTAAPAPAGVQAPLSCCAMLCCAPCAVLCFLCYTWHFTKVSMSARKSPVTVALDNKLKHVIAPLETPPY